jgi:GAF domain-containing protein
VKRLKSWWQRESKNSDAVVVGLALGIAIPLVMSALSEAEVFEALPPLVWLAIAGVAGVFLIGVLTGRSSGRRLARREAERRIERLADEARESIEREVESVRRDEQRLREEREQVAEKYAEHVSDALRTLEQVIAGRISSVKVGDFIQEGLFEPAHAILAQPGTRGELRFSVLEPDGNEFRMSVAHGHAMESRRRFRLEITGSFAGLALQSGDVKWSNDLPNDSRYQPHPRARPGREYRSMVCVPLEHGAGIFAVLVVIATERDAFSSADRIYLRTLGSIIEVAWAVTKAQGDRREAS